jgi:putative iron-only hydrogenase system regulator
MPGPGRKAARIASNSRLIQMPGAWYSIYGSKPGGFVPTGMAEGSRYTHADGLVARRGRGSPQGRFASPVPLGNGGFLIGGQDMETRIALIGIIVEDLGQAERLNGLLHEYGAYIVGRMGIPYRTRGVSIISVVVDAPMPVIGALAGKLGMLPGVQTKTVYSKAGGGDGNG